MTSTHTRDGRKRLPFTVGNVLVILISVITSGFAATILSDTLRIRWHVGPYEHWGPEVVPAEFVLISFPVLIGCIYVASLVIDRSTTTPPRSELLEIVVLVTLVSLLIMQLVILALNVVIR